MPNWVPAVAVIGLVCLMIIPAPGVLGVVIGGGCVLAIAISAFMYMLDRLATGLIAFGRGAKKSLSSGNGRAVHKHSGVVKAVSTKRRASSSLI